MATAPYGIRLLVGAATVAVEETRKLPHTILTYPLTLASQAAHLVMLWQQSMADLVNKGDSTLEALFPPKDEQPEWATFDEDLGEDGDDFNGDGAAGDDGAAGVNGGADGPGAPSVGSDGGPRTPGRFALYSEPARLDSETNTTAGDGHGGADAKALTPPGIATELDYGTLTLAQLRARLRSLSTEELQALLSYEEATKARPPFQTLLANRINHATPK